MANIRDAALRVTSAFEALGIAYALGGSYASSVHGVARPTQDLDIVAAISPTQVSRFVAALERDFYVDGASRPLNVVDLATGFKVDVFVVDGDPFAVQQIRRRCLADASFAVISAEDTILVKLRWYRDGGQTSERQWNDLRNIVTVQGERLDGAYLDEWSRELGVHDLLRALLAETKKGGIPDSHA